ncbi:DUF2339 domain-containing protein [Patescibacteria group bacterium]|nr:DUF2339 domain-containing protein [Patescibacteria group bacterium]MBU4601201.1 DUF2339 domain-containing protein [Patescibacteria group bacterium]MCG2698234.1 DUF2339 domain-containing protein [Candidatus Parcubacteria bacterium]
MQEENNKNELLNYLEKFKKASFLLDEKLAKQDQKIENLKKETEVLKEDLRSRKKEGLYPVQSQTAVQAPPPPPPPADDYISEEPKTEAGEIKEKIGLEEIIGGKWFAKIGMTALVIGVSFFLKYAFDNDWIGPTGRVIMGIIAGIVLLFFGEKYIRKYFVYSQIITGGGIALLYLSVFAAFDFYGLIPQWLAFVFMSLVTGTGVLLSLRYNALSLITVSILGGFITPFLLSTGVDNQIGLFSYILLLDLAILAVSIFKKWRALNIIGFFGTVITFLSWGDRFYTEEKLFSTVFFLTLFFLVYSISSLIYNLVKKENSTGIEQVLTLLAGVFYFSASYSLLDHDHHEFMGFFALIMAIYYFLWAYSVRAITSKDENLYNFLAFLTVGFITVAIPIQFKQNIITIGWSIEALLLLYLGLKVMQKPIILFGSTIAGLVMARLLFIDSQLNLKDYLVFINKRFFTFIFAVAVFYIIGFIFSKGKKIIQDNDFAGQIKKLMAVWLIAANFFTLFAVSQEIISYHENQIKELRAESGAIYQEWSQSRVDYKKPFKNKRYEELQAEVKTAKQRSSIALSLFWLFYAIILLAVGFIGKYKTVRVGGILLLALAILKLFFYDLWSLGTLYRIISSISLGAVLLSISFVYQKYKDKIKEII